MVRAHRKEGETRNEVTQFRETEGGEDGRPAKMQDCQPSLKLRPVKHDCTIARLHDKLSDPYDYLPPELAIFCKLKSFA